MILLQKGYLTQDSVTGYYGALTQAAVKKYQCDNGIVCSGNESTTGYGMVGNLTKTKINSDSRISTPVVSSTPTQTPTVSGSLTPVLLTRNLYIGQTGNDVVSLQNYLIGTGYLASGNNTGYFGLLTQTAIKNFQCDKTIICTGDEASTGWGQTGPTTRLLLSK